MGRLTARSLGLDPGEARTLRDAVVERLRAAGCVSAEDEAAELVAYANGDATLVEGLVARRVVGEPLAWITGTVSFLGSSIRVDAGVYVPRWQTAIVAARAAVLLPEGGAAIDLCCGSGAVAVALKERRPSATVVATDVDHVAVECARRNGVEAFVGDLYDPIDESLRGVVDVVVAVPPYVPTAAIATLARDVVEYEPQVAVDGGDEGLAVARRIAVAAPGWLRDGGALVVELGGTQAGPFGAHLSSLGFVGTAVLVDGDGDPCGVSAAWRRET